jgi:hypothetical protein
MLKAMKMCFDGSVRVRLLGLLAIVLISGFHRPCLAVRGGIKIVENLATGKEAYMVRLQDSLPPAAHGNDGDIDTVVTTTTRTVDAYWEVDLEQEYAVTHVQIVPAPGFEERTQHATLRLFDGQHNSVYAKKLSLPFLQLFDVDLRGARRARYVRVGYEYKERSSPDNSIEWYLGLAEVMVFGGPLSEVGLLSFEAVPAAVNPGEKVTLSWESAGIREFKLYPDSPEAAPLLDGSGQQDRAPDVTTEYTLVAEGSHGRDIQARTVVVEGKHLPVRINEFVARNQLSLEDGNGDDPDWIELYNPNNEAVNLAGYGLSDDPDSPFKWTFPNVDVPAHTTLVVFASGNTDSMDPAGFLHADWRLSANGGSVLLTAPDGAVLDQILDYPALDIDLAYGRTMDGTLTFLDPTPHAVNLAVSYEGWLAPLVFSHTRGYYDADFHLFLQHADPNATITYSLNGRQPYLAYHRPIAMTGTQTVRATVKRPGYRSPRIQTHTFLNIDDVVTSPLLQSSIAENPSYRDRLRQGLLDLPSVSLAVPSLPDNYREQEASVEILWPEAQSAVQANCGMRRYGGAWTTFAKKNYRLKFRRSYGAPKFRVPLFTGFDRGFPVQETFDELDLAGGSHDMNSRGFYMASRFVEDSMLDMGSLNPHGRFVHLYINGSSWGLYHLRERLVEHFMADYLGGEPEDYLNVRGNDNVGGSFIPGTPDPIHRHVWQHVRAVAGSYQDVRAYLDVPHLVDFMLLWFYGDCETEYRASGPADAGSGFKFWMADADGFLRTRALGRNATSNPGPAGLFGRLVSERDPDFMTLLADRIYRHMAHDGPLTPARNTARLTERMTEIQDALVAECARWGYRTPSNWQAAATDIIDTLFPERTDELVALLRNRGLYTNFDPPRFNQRGGSVPRGFPLFLSADTGMIAYTLDGSDPRLPGGALSPAARTYQTSGSTRTLVPAGAVWRYWDRGTALPADWHDIAFDDTAWQSGPAQLGYGDGDEATTVGYGPSGSSKYITTYFRHVFTVDDPAAIDQLQLKLMRDDSAVVYLNGSEIVRDNLPAGSIDASTRAVASVGGATESQWFSFAPPVGRLVAGSNVLAVEVHQSGPTSSDISFNLSLEARQTQATDQEPILLTEDTVVRTRTLDGGQWSALNEARFVIAD